ncbi:MAG: HAD family hydrolase [Propionibacterium sp.]
MTEHAGWTVGFEHPGAMPPHEAVIFDLDDVVADTAALHAAAWKRLIEEVLADPRAGTPDAGAMSEPFDTVSDYRRYIADRPAQEGVRVFLAARGIRIPPGRPADPPGAWSVQGLAGRKDQIFLSLVAAAGVRAFPGTVDLLQRLKAGHVPTAVVTTSPHADLLLKAAGLAALFDVVVDARQVGHHLPGPSDAPSVLAAAAEALHVDPARTAVVTAAASRITAARRGGFGLVVGVARDGQRAQLTAAGAQLVVEDVGQLDLGALRVDPWMLIYEGFDPAHEAHREALTTLGNGYLGTRGAAPESGADGVHYPGTYLAGVYNRLTSQVGGRSRQDEHLVNAPNWLVLDLRVGQGAWWSQGGLSMVAERRELDLRRGVLTRTATLADPQGRRLLVTQRRLVSMARPHLAALETTVVALGWETRVQVRAGVDTSVVNANVADDAALANRHLRVLNAVAEAGGRLLVEVETSQSHIRIAAASRLTCLAPGASPARLVDDRPDQADQVLELDLIEDRPVRIDKTVALFTSRDGAIASPGLAALHELDVAPGGLADLLPAHVHAWADLWHRFGVDLDADVQTRLVLNLHVFHLLQSLSEHTADLDAGVPARGLHGEGYRGHVFWDELFVLPVLTAHQPQISRGLLEYRYRRLDAARLAAAGRGLAGAMFPWQSGSDGREETPPMLFNPRSGRWMRDNSWRQRHVGLAIAYNAWQFYQATGDTGWLAARGADLIIEVACVFADLATYEPDTDRFHIEGVMGPDEYHDGYPGAPGEGLRDNAYTNVLAAWVCQRAGDVLGEVEGFDCDRVHSRLRIQAGERQRWEHLSRRLAVPFHQGVISQFAGYEDLAELDWDHYRTTYGNIGRLDLILEAEGDSTNRYRLAKQADVLMLPYLLGPQGLTQTLARLGYPVSEQDLRRTVDYYLSRTADGSTLSRVVHAAVLARLDPAKAWGLFQAALSADLDDTQGGTTGHGIHLGAMAGTIDIITRAFAGITTHGDGVLIDPRMPVGLGAARFTLLHHGQRLRVALTPTTTDVSADPCAANPHVTVSIGPEPQRAPKRDQE